MDSLDKQSDVTVKEQHEAELPSLENKTVDPIAETLGSSEKSMKKTCPFTSQMQKIATWFRSKLKRRGCREDGSVKTGVEVSDTNISAFSVVKQNKKVMHKIDALIRSLEKGQASRENSIDRMLAKTLKEYQKNYSEAERFHREALARIDNAVGSLSGVDGSLAGIRKYLDENSQIMRRYEEGYDYQILRKFVRQLIRLIRGYDKQLDRIESVEAKEVVEEARDDLIEILDRNDISVIDIAQESIYAGQEKLAEVISEPVLTDDPAKVGCIAGVSARGFIYTFNTKQKRVIEPAKVKLYIMGEK